MQMSEVVSNVSKATWPRDLGLSGEQFEFKIWRDNDSSSLRGGAKIVSGEIVLLQDRHGYWPKSSARARTNKRATTTQVPLKHAFVTAVKPDGNYEVQPSGMREKIEAKCGEVRKCRGGDPGGHCVFACF